MRLLAEWVATAGGVGRLPAASGTFGSLVGLGMGLAAAKLAAPVEWVLLVGLFSIGVWSSTVTERALGTTDPGCVVIDEVWGMWATLAAAGWLLGVWWGVAVAFGLFRVFDILKPWPLKRLEQCPAGWGIMLDDAGAAVYASVILAVAKWLSG